VTEPSIFRDKVVWIDDKGEIILYNLTLKRQTVIVQSSEIALGLVLSGNRIIWNEYDDNYDGDAPTTHIYDFSTQKEIFSFLLVKQGAFKKREEISYNFSQSLGVV